jgi:diguanylate cyclase (GGDEF)-like protein
VPGSDLERTAELADRLREGVAAEPVVVGLSVTMSVGVGASEQNERFDYAAVFAAADAALYRAKRSGRNRVCVAERESQLDHAADAVLGLHQLEAAVDVG